MWHSWFFFFTRFSKRFSCGESCLRTLCCPRQDNSPAPWGALSFHYNLLQLTSYYIIIWRRFALWCSLSRHWLKVMAAVSCGSEGGSLNRRGQCLNKAKKDVSDSHHSGMTDIYSKINPSARIGRLISISSCRLLFAISSFVAGDSRLRRTGAQSFLTMSIVPACITL